MPSMGMRNPLFNSTDRGSATAAGAATAAANAAAPAPLGAGPFQVPVLACGKMQVEKVGKQR